jgi:hypothetical protein
MSAPSTKYPLTWPPGWRRISPFSRKKSRFSAAGESLDVGKGTRRLLAELKTFGVPESQILISSNLKLRNDGLPYSQQATAGLDPGVAVYWKRNGKEQCMAMDRYDRIADNLAALAATIAAMRAIERHGGAEILDRAFTGFAALPAPEQWWQVLGVSSSATEEEIKLAYRRAASIHHPDAGGDAGEMARINRARDQGLEQFQ